MNLGKMILEYKYTPIFLAVAIFCLSIISLFSYSDEYSDSDLHPVVFLW